MLWGLLEPRRKRGSKIFNCGGARCVVGSTIATGSLTISVVHYRENDMRIDAGVSTDHVRRNAPESASISSYVDGGGSKCCDSQNRTIGTAENFVRGLPLILAKYNLDASEIFDFTEGSFLKVCWPATRKMSTKSFGSGLRTLVILSSVSIT
ncbi:hypothetical protein EDB83DRAFT_1830602 [Lactarius deliciosus]|nr:hypothetical protein EDB83DRAFT_1830602 [Lactarius deliciosus]